MPLARSGADAHDGYITKTIAPTTLRQLAGLSSDPLQFEDATLIIIDTQVAYASAGQLPLEHVDSATSRSLPSATGSGIVAAANVHQAALAALDDRLSVVA